MRPSSLPELLEWLSTAPDATLFRADDLRSMLAPLATPRTQAEPLPTDAAPTWRERVWTVPAETRLGVAEMAECAGRSEHWVYRHTAKSAGDARLPHRKLDGELVFVAGEIRTWMQDHEEVIAKGRTRPALSISPRRAS